MIPVMAVQTPIESKGMGSDLKARIGSGVVLAAIGLAAVHAGGWWFVALAVVLALLLVFEWNRITDRAGMVPMMALHSVFVATALLAGALGEFRIALMLIAVGAATSFAFAALTARNRLWPLLAVPYFALPCLAIVWLRFDASAGAALVYWLLASIWATDTGAYAVGRTVGGPKLSPRISPKKTWSGLIGGIVAAVLVGGVTAWSVGLASPVAAAAISGLIAVWSQVGDLCESAVKRHFGVKDSSRLIPGHGGFLDRLDGLLFAAPLAAAAVLLGAVS